MPVLAVTGFGTLCRRHYGECECSQLGFRRLLTVRKWLVGTLGAATSTRQWRLVTVRFGYCRNSYCYRVAQA